MRLEARFVALASLLSLAGCTAHKPSGAITIDGSATVYPLSQAMASAFHSANPAVNVDVRFSGTGGGFRKFCAGQTDIEGASRPIKASEGEQCKGHHVDYIELAVAFDSLSVVVNPQNDFVSCLTVKELRTIWEPSAQGRVTNWQQVRSSFPSRPLVLFGPGKDSGTFDYFTAAIVGSEAESRSDYAASEDDMVIERGVEGEPNALGYFGYAYYQANKSKLKLVSVDSGHGCVAPSAESVAVSSYQPLSRPLFLYVKLRSASRPEVKAFTHFYIGPGSSRYVTQVGYVPLLAPVLAAQAARFDKGVTGSALGGHGSVLGVNPDWFHVNEEERVKAELVQ